jgi:hypothetical protein
MAVWLYEIHRVELRSDTDIDEEIKSGPRLWNTRLGIGPNAPGTGRLWRPDLSIHIQDSKTVRLKPGCVEY